MDQEAHRVRPESWAEPPPPPPVAAGSPTISQWLERVAYAPVDHSIMLLSVLTILLVSLAFIISIIKYWYEPQLILMYSVFMFFNAVLYFRRRLLRHWPPGLHRHHLLPWLRRRQRRWLRCGLGYAAILLGAAFMFAFFYYSSPPSTMPMPASPLRVGVCFCLLAVGEYFFYCLVVLHLDQEEEAMQIMHVHTQV